MTTNEKASLWKQIIYHVLSNCHVISVWPLAKWRRLCIQISKSEMVHVIWFTLSL